MDDSHSVRGTQGHRGQSDDIGDFVSENLDLITRVLAYGNPEGRAYALALLANGGTITDVEEVQRELRAMKEQLSG